MVDYNKLLNELATREGEIVEWKENVADERKLIETIVAFTNDFLNLGGGYIVCGAKEITDVNGFKSVEYVGLTASNLEKLKKYISNTCYNPTKVNPPIIPKFDEIRIPSDDTKRVLLITVDATANAHSYKADNDIKHRYFVRTDSNTRAATNGLERELLRRKGQLEPWDKQINQKANLEDLDLLILRQYLQDMKLWDPNQMIEDYLSYKNKIEEFVPPLLGKLGVDKPLYPKNFAIMVFGRSPIDFCTGAYSIFSIFDGVDKGKQHLEDQWITGTIVEQAHKLIELLNVETTVLIDKSAKNANQTKYPQIALKEAVVNAVVHRDYEIDQPTRVEVYQDRVEIYSPGGLPFNVDKTKFKLGKSKAAWRNQSFGRIFRKLNLAQHQGTGIARIITSMQEEGCPMPIFEVDDFSVTCILPAHPRHQIRKQLSAVENDIIAKNYLDAFEKLRRILNDDIYNYRAMELFCEVNNLMGTPEQILSLIISQSIDFQHFRLNTLIIMAETLSLKKDENTIRLSKKLLEIAMKNRLDVQQLIKIAATWSKLGDDKAVIDFVNNVINEYVHLTNNPYLLDQKGRAFIQLAKKSKQIFNERPTRQIKNKSKIDFENYILESKKILRQAIENAENEVQKSYILKALDSIDADLLPLQQRKTN
jgi:ATP-dependent DNA helicase RecG